MSSKAHNRFLSVDIPGSTNRHENAATSECRRRSQLKSQGTTSEWFWTKAESYRVPLSNASSTRIISLVNWEDPHVNIFLKIRLIKENGPKSAACLPFWWWYPITQLETRPLSRQPPLLLIPSPRCNQRLYIFPPDRRQCLRRFRHSKKRSPGL